MSFDSDHPTSFDDDSELEDNHSGTRLVLFLFLIPLSVLCGWAALVVCRELFAGLGHVAAQRAGYAGGAITLFAVVMVMLRWQSAFSFREQARYEGEIDAMDTEDESEEEDFDFDDD